jgi:isopenicillin N synthase-like dioxygenase
MNTEVPLVELDASLDHFLTHHKYSDSAASMVQSIGDSLSQWGFVSLSGHGVSETLLSRAYAVAQETFALSETQKIAYEDRQGGRQRGYTPLLKEKAKGQNQGDLKEFWHIGRELPQDHPYRFNGLMRDNLYPQEVTHFKSVMGQLYQAMDQLAHLMLKVIESYLGINNGVLTEIATEGNSVLRVLHYPELSRFGSRSEMSIRAAAHEDINLLTLLPAATQPGLQLLTREGDWLNITPPPGTIILDTGDMMTAVTGGAMPATTHRVINPQGMSDGGRLSMPFFMHPRPDAILSALLKSDVQCEGVGLTAQAFLDRRLSENGLV